MRRDALALLAAITGCFWLSWFGLAVVDDDGMSWQQTWLMVALLGWVAGLGWKALFGLRRSLAVALVPVVVLPLGIFALLRRAWFPIRFVWRMIRRRALTVSRTEIIPPTWDHLLAFPSILRRLLPAREVVLGLNESRVIMASLDDDRHLLITGSTGQGKTTIVWAILLGLLAQGPAVFSKVQFSIHDPKGIFAPFLRPLTDLYPDFIQVYTDTDESKSALQVLYAEMKNRTRRMGKERVFSPDELNLSRQMVIIDEPQIFYDDDKEFQPLVKHLVNEGRQAGYHIVELTAYGKGDVIDTSYRVNFRPISGKLPKHAESVVGMPVSKLGKYQFLYQPDDADKPIMFTTYKIKSAHVVAAVDRFMAMAQQESASAFDIALDVFMHTPNCGMRTLLQEGALRCQVLQEQGLLRQVPFPWRDVKVNGNLQTSKRAWEWAQQFLADLGDAGIASVPGPGQARQPLVNLEQAKTLWKKENVHG